MTLHGRSKPTHLVLLALALVTCGPERAHKLQNGRYQFSGASLINGLNHSAIICNGDFKMELQDSDQGPKLSPEGELSCEAPSQPSFRIQLGGQCPLEDIVLISVNNRFLSEGPKISCEPVPENARLWLQPESTGFLLRSTANHGLFVEYIFTKAPQ